MAKTQMCWCSFPADSCTPANAGPKQMCLVISLLCPKSISEMTMVQPLGLKGNIFSQESLSRKIKNQTKAK